VIGHVGNKVGALVDGQLPREEAERLWHHVNGCRRCSAKVEREGWVKMQLAGLASTWPESAPLGLREGLADRAPLGMPHAPLPPLDPAAGHRGLLTVAVLGAGSLGAAMIGVIALNVASGDPHDGRTAVTSFQTPGTGSTASRTTPQP
jgi:anti-sigma factor RsiW